MFDAFAYCAQLVREADRDRFVASLFAPAELRGALYALYAFNSEVARVRDIAREPLPGEIRLQWWSDILRGERDGEAQANPVAAALLATIEQRQLSAVKLTDLIEARRFDLYDEPMSRIADLEAYARRISSAGFALAAKILAGVEAEAVIEPAGIAYAIGGLLRAFPIHAARGQLYVPNELLDRHDVRAREIFGGRSSAGLVAALAELRALALKHLAAAHAQIATLPTAAVPAVLPVAPVRPALERLARHDPFAPAEIPAWQRQWLIWRAARNPERITGSM